MDFLFHLLRWWFFLNDFWEKTQRLFFHPSKINWSNEKIENDNDNYNAGFSGGHKCNLDSSIAALAKFSLPPNPHPFLALFAYKEGEFFHLGGRDTISKSFKPVNSPDQTSWSYAPNDVVHPLTGIEESETYKIHQWDDMTDFISCFAWPVCDRSGLCMFIRCNVSCHNVHGTPIAGHVWHASACFGRFQCFFP